MDLYMRYEGYINTIKNLSKEWDLIFKLIKKFYLEYTKVSVDAQELHDYYDLCYPNARNAEDVHMFITDIFQREDKPEMIQAIIEQMVEKYKATKMIEMLAPTMTGDKYGKLPDIVREAEDFFDIMENPPEEMDRPQPLDMTISEVVQEELIFDGLEWPLDCFNDYLGGIRRGTLGLIYAYVDCGKTSLAMNIAAHAARQLAGTDECICYLGNEEPAKRLFIRGVQAFKHCTRRDVIKNHEQYTKECMKWGFDRLKFFGGVDNGDQVTSILKELKPRLAIIDIATDVDVKMEKHYGSEGVGYLKSLFKWYRRTTNRFDTSILAVSQGTGDIENKRYPKLSDVMGSRSAVQGALDYAIGVGQKIDDASKKNVRYINIPKNKLHDGEKAKFTVTFLPEVNEWKD
jgi:hypothetical protein